jgi:enoyl-CoA hydratase/carnithine racemase
MDVVIYEKKGNIAYLKLNRPQARNAINREMAERLVEIWKDFRDDDSLHVAILSGNGKSFCVGADITEHKMGEGEKWTFNKSLLFGDTRISPLEYQVWKPIIASVHHHVLGGGFFLAMECDIVIASEDAEFALPEPRVSLPTLLAPFLYDYLPRCLAMELLLVCDRISARRAFEMGICNRVVPSQELMNTADQIAERILLNGPLSIKAVKELCHRSRHMDYLGRLSLIEHICTPVWNSDDAAEGRQAFYEKRKPIWKNK